MQPTVSQEKKTKTETRPGNRKRNYWNHFREMVIAKSAMRYSSIKLTYNRVSNTVHTNVFCIQFIRMYQQQSELTSSILFCVKQKNILNKTKMYIINVHKNGPCRRFFENKCKNNKRFQKALKTPDSPCRPEPRRKYSVAAAGPQVYTASEGKFLNFSLVETLAYRSFDPAPDERHSM